MLGRRFCRRSGCEQIVGRAVNCFDLAHGRPPLGESPGLVEHNGVHQPIALKRFAGAHQDALLGCFAGPAHNRQRRGDADSARITHDEHAQSRKHRPLDVHLAGDQPRADEPAGRGKHRHDQHGRGVDAQHAVDEMQDAGLERSGILDLANDFVEKAAFSDGRHLDEKRAGAVDGPADHGVALGSLNGNGLAGNERLVNG